MDLQSQMLDVHFSLVVSNNNSEYHEPFLQRKKSPVVFRVRKPNELGNTARRQANEVLEHRQQPLNRHTAQGGSRAAEEGGHSV